MIQNFNIGTVYGIYQILGEGLPDKDNHKRLHVKCIVCGVEKDIRPINLGATVCRHKQKIMPRYCECCGNLIPFNLNTKAADYKLRKFCSASCAAKVNNQRPHSEASRLRASKTALAKRYVEGVAIYEAKCKAKLVAGQQTRSVKNASKYYTEGLIENVDYVICPYCGLRFSQIQKSHLKLHNKTLDDLFNDFGKNYKIVSDKTFNKKVEAGKAVQQRLLDEGIHNGWQSRKITSYAEQFWQQVLDNNNIKYDREVLVTCNKTHYFLDFKILKNNSLIDLEIDGKQHTYADRIESDKVRDTNLTALGYIVYRIPWNEVNSEQGKAAMKLKIEQFLAFYTNI